MVLRDRLVGGAVEWGREQEDGCMIGTKGWRDVCWVVNT